MSDRKIEQECVDVGCPQLSVYDLMLYYFPDRKGTISRVRKLDEKQWLEAYEKRLLRKEQAVSVDNHIDIGSAVGIGLRGIFALSRLTDDDSDDPEEQKRKQEAAWAASCAGAVLGLAMGAISAVTKNNQSLTRIPDEKQIIEEEENFNEFLARMDEEYGYIDEQQMM